MENTQTVLTMHYLSTMPADLVIATSVVLEHL
jgi:hypothetical protein